MKWPLRPWVGLFMVGWHAFHGQKKDLYFNPMKFSVQKMG